MNGREEAAVALVGAIGLTALLFLRSQNQAQLPAYGTAQLDTYLGRPRIRVLDGPSPDPGWQVAAPCVDPAKKPGCG